MSSYLPWLECLYLFFGLTLVSFRKVASISGDCRRALDICRRAAEIAEKDCVGRKIVVSMAHVVKTFDEMISNPKVVAIKGCSKYEKLFLQAVAAEVSRWTLFEQS